MELNWENESDYDYLDSLNLTELAFEFLRRNPEYLADYHEIKKIEDRVTKALQNKEGADSNPFINKPSPHLIYEPPWLPGESKSDWMKRIFESGTDPKFYHFKDWYRRKWGILTDTIPDPENVLNESLQLDVTGGFPLEPNFESVGDYFFGDSDEFFGYEPFSQHPQFHVLVFDLESSIKHQLSIAEKLLLKKQGDGKEQNKLVELSTHKTGNYKSTLKRYLRLLDADFANADSKSIREKLMGDSINMPNPNYGYDKVSDNRKRAHKFRDYQYRAIPGWSINSD